jgi:hypothetical protein
MRSLDRDLECGVGGLHISLIKKGYGVSRYVGVGVGVRFMCVVVGHIRIPVRAPWWKNNHFINSFRMVFEILIYDLISPGGGKDVVPMCLLSFLEAHRLS